MIETAGLGTMQMGITWEKKDRFSFQGPPNYERNEGECENENILEAMKKVYRLWSGFHKYTRFMEEHKNHGKVAQGDIKLNRRTYNFPDDDTSVTVDVEDNFDFIAHVQFSKYNTPLLRLGNLHLPQRAILLPGPQAFDNGWMIGSDVSKRTIEQVIITERGTYLKLYDINAKNKRSTDHPWVRTVVKAGPWSEDPREAIGPFGDVHSLSLWVTDDKWRFQVPPGTIHRDIAIPYPTVPVELYRNKENYLAARNHMGGIEYTTRVGVEDGDPINQKFDFNPTEQIRYMDIMKFALQCSQQFKDAFGK